MKYNRPIIDRFEDNYVPEPNNRDRAQRGRSVDHWKGSCKNGHDLDSHGYHRANGTRYCATCSGLNPRPKNGAWV